MTLGLVLDLAKKVVCVVEALGRREASSQQKTSCQAWLSDGAGPGGGGALGRGHSQIAAGRGVAGNARGIGILRVLLFLLRWCKEIGCSRK